MTSTTGSLKTYMSLATMRETWSGPALVLPFKRESASVKAILPAWRAFERSGSGRLLSPVGNLF